MVVNGSEEPGYAGLIEKLKQYQDSLATIEDWIEGENPSGLALKWGPTSFSELRRAPLSAENVDFYIDRETR